MHLLFNKVRHKWMGTLAPQKFKLPIWVEASGIHPTTNKVPIRMEFYRNHLTVPNTHLYLWRICLWEVQGNQVDILRAINAFIVSRKSLQAVEWCCSFR